MTTSNKGKAKLSIKRTLTIEQRKLLASGYIDELRNKNKINQIIPIDIIELCHQYYIPNVNEFSVGIDQHFLEISRDKNAFYQILQSKSSKDITTQKLSSLLYSEQAISSTDRMIHEWNIKCIHTHSNDIIGFVQYIDNIDKSIKIYNDTLFGNAIIWWKNTRHIWINGCGQHVGVFNANDSMKIIFDTNNWSIEFIRNKASVHKVQLEDKNVTYYAVILVGSGKSVYHNLLK